MNGIDLTFSLDLSLPARGAPGKRHLPHSTSRVDLSKSPKV